MRAIKFVGISAGAFLFTTGCVVPVAFTRTPEPAPTVTVTATPTVEAAPTTQAPAPTSSELSEDEQITLMNLAWEGITASDRENICMGVDVFGVEWVVEQMELEAQVSNELMAEFFTEKCDA